MQFLVNCASGTIIGTGLYLLGVPSASVVGRAGSFSALLALHRPGDRGFSAVCAGAGGERRLAHAAVGDRAVRGDGAIIANFIEPLLYGVHTGLSAVAILVSAVFSTCALGADRAWRWPRLALQRGA